MRRHTQDRYYERRRGSGRGILLTLIFAAALCLMAGPSTRAHSATEVPLEYQLKAAFLHKFIRFVEWPHHVLTDAHRSITIGVMGQGPMGEAVAQFEGKEIMGRKVVVRCFGGLEDLEFCHVLFVPREEEEHIAEILKV